MNPRVKIVLHHLLRLIIGGVFLFSGFIKSVDPIGTSVFVEKYLSTYSATWLMPMALYIAVALAVVEITMGVMLIVRAFLRVAYKVTAISIILFTIITLLNATILPIGECGCFGDAIRLTPIQSLLKNLVMLPIVVWLLRCAERDTFAWWKIGVVVCTIVGVLGVNLYAIRHLPIIDFMPYKVGLNLRDSIDKERAREEESVRSILLFKDKTTGNSVRFDADNIECWSDDNLEYIDAYAQKIEVEDSKFSDFRIYDTNGEECSLELLNREGRYLWLCIYSLDALNNNMLCKIKQLQERYPKPYITTIVASDADVVSRLIAMPCYSMDAMTMRSMMRAPVGVMVIDDGVIIDKRHIRDI